MQKNKAKIFLSSGLIIASVLYAIFQDAANPQKLTTIATIISPSEQKPPVGSPVPAPVVSTPTSKTPTPTVPKPAEKPAPKPAGQYANGTYTGDAADAYYGTVQIKAVIKNGALADARFLQYPNDRSTSRYISSKAMPMLTSEALQAQSANVDIVSGATATSQAFQQSLGSALAQAKN